MNDFLDNIKLSYTFYKVLNYFYNYKKRFNVNESLLTMMVTI